MSETGPRPDDAEARLVRYDRVLRHPPERVWEALTNPTDVRQWMGADSVVLEGRVGGRFELRGILNGEGLVLAWEPPTLLEHAFRLKTPAGLLEESVLKYELRPEGAGTRLTMTFRSTSPALGRLFFQGRAATFDRIEAFLDGRPVPPLRPGKPGP